MRLSLNKINNQTVKAVPLMFGGDNRPVKGADLFAEVYANIYCNAKKKSGKTSVIFKIIKECAGRDTIIIAFVSTLHKDPIWRSIRHYCENKGIMFEGYTSMMEDGVDVLEEIISGLQQPDEEEEEKEKKPKYGGIRFDDSDDDEEGRKKRKTKYLAPEYIFIFDDLSTELKSRSLVSLLKKNRHFKCKTIISSQYWNDLLPESRKQLDYILIFRGMPDTKLKEIHRDADLSINFDVFEKLYKFCTMKPFDFMYINTRNDEIRRNFNYKIDIQDSN